MVSLKTLAASSIPSVVLRGMLRVSRSVINAERNPSLCFYCLSGVVSLGRECVVSTSITGEWSDDRSRQDVAAAEFGGIPFVTEKVQKVVLFISVRGPVDRREMA
jgi:hypothetical protein